MLSFGIVVAEAEEEEEEENEKKGTPCLVCLIFILDVQHLFVDAMSQSSSHIGVLNGCSCLFVFYAREVYHASCHQLKNIAPIISRS